MAGRCARRVVRAVIVTPNGSFACGNNDCVNPQSACPRAHLPGGEGYDICRGICLQKAHAEINAINNAIEKGLDISGSVMIISGHYHSCENCLREMTRYKINDIVFLTNNLEEWP